MGLENIKQGEPTIIACNHPSAFIEPCLLACFLPIKLHFLVRGDLFSKGWLSWLLKGTNQIPIFRIKDGIENVKKNHLTQKAVEKLFAGNNSVLMFPEAHTHENLFLRPLKKGLARFAFMNDHDGLNILPIGVNFDKNIKFGSKVSIVIGKPLNVANFKRQEFKDRAEMNRLLLEDVSTRMKGTIRHIDNEEREEVIHDVFRLEDAKNKLGVLPFVSNDSNAFEKEKRLATKIDSSLGEYESYKELAKMSDLSRYVIPTAVDIIFMLALLPIFCISYLLILPTLVFTKWIIKKKVKVHEFKAPVFIAVMVFQYIFLVITLAVAGFFDFRFYLILLGLLLSVVIATTYLKSFRRQWNYIFSSKTDRIRYQEFEKKSKLAYK